MAEAITDRDLRGLVDVIEEGKRAPSPVGVPMVVLEKLHRLIRCDQVSFNELSPDARALHCLQEFPAEPGGPDLDGLDPDMDPFWTHFWRSPHCSYSLVSGDVRTITTLSDFYTHQEWHDTGMYTDWLSRYGVERQAMLCLSAPPGRARRVLFVRFGGRDFDSRERTLLSLIRPHLNELYQDLERSRHLPPRLTKRQYQLMSLVARGHSNIEIARLLSVSPATIRTHLENIFRLLGVSSRTAAVARVFPPTPY